MNSVALTEWFHAAKCFLQLVVEFSPGWGCSFFELMDAIPAKYALA